MPSYGNSAATRYGSSAIQHASAPWLCGAPPSARVRENGEPLGTTYRSLYKFKAQPDGAAPYDELVAVGDKLYGTTDLGGATGYGSVFEITTTGREHVIYSFKGGNDGAYPCAGLLYIDGQFYGTTQSGGTSGWGTIFDVDASGKEHVLYAFKAGNDGAAPYGGLTTVKGKLYGTTVEGGASGWGTVFESTTSGATHVIYSFKGGRDGGYPYCTLTAVKGTLYGTAQQGGVYGWGTVFAVTTAGKKRNVYSFAANNKGTNDGAYPFDGLTYLGSRFYGTTKDGGKSGYGTVFAVTTTGVERILHSFADGSDGAYPYAGLLDVSGTLYGTTYQGGGSGNWGTVFKIGTGGSESVLYRFKASSDGAWPFSRLVALAGRLYGTTIGGGVNGGWGTVFSIAP
jgi:uncharacterized repeat protein (TIGR03803 family)